MAIQKTKTPLDRSRHSHPENRGFEAPRTGVLGTILTDLRFDEEAQQELADLQLYLEDRVETLAEIAAWRARQVVDAHEGFGSQDPLAGPAPVRPAIARLRKRVAVQWLKATLEGRFDSYFAKQLRDSWLPILLSDPVQGRPAPIQISGFLSYMQGFVTGLLMDECDANFVPAVRKAHGWKVAIDIQRRLLGVD